MDELMRKDQAPELLSHEFSKASEETLQSEDLSLDGIFQRETADSATNRSLFELGYNFEEVRDWLSIEQPTKEPLKLILRYMMENHLKTSVQIEINKMRFNCHLIVLQAYSNYFTELQSNPVVVSLPEEKVSQKAFMLIYKWMLSDEPHVERKHIVAIFVAATYLRIQALLLHCWQQIEDINCFNEDSACVLYVETQNNPALDIVRNLMLSRIQKFLLTFVASREFLNVPLKHLIYLLNSKEICVNTEVEVLFIAVRWLGHDWPLRQINVSSLITCVCFGAMPLWYLLWVRRVESHMIIKYLIQLPDVDATINEAISQKTFQMYQQKMEANVFVLGNMEQRRWLQDEACPYFHHIGCPNTRDITFKKFESYLAILQQKPRDYWAKVPLLDINNPKKCDCIQ